VVRHGPDPTVLLARRPVDGQQSRQVGEIHVAVGVVEVVVILGVRDVLGRQQAADAARGVN